MRFFSRKKENYGSSLYRNEGFSVSARDEDAFEAEASKGEEQKPSLSKEIIEWLEIFAVAMVAVVFIFSLIFRVATIDGTSMLDTLHAGDKVIISNINYEPRQGDIVVISRNIRNAVDLNAKEPIIKRVIAVGGETVNIDFESGTVYVDGKALQEKYISTPTTRKHEVDFPVYVPEGYIFVLGDNREVSLDSRSSQIGENGLIDTRYVLGKAVFRVFPFQSIGGLYK